MSYVRGFDFPVDHRDESLYGRLKRGYWGFVKGVRPGDLPAGMMGADVISKPEEFVLRQLREGSRVWDVTSRTQRMVPNVGWVDVSRTLTAGTGSDVVKTFGTKYGKYIAAGSIGAALMIGTTVAWNLAESAKMLYGHGLMSQTIAEQTELEKLRQAGDLSLAAYYRESERLKAENFMVQEAFKQYGYSQYQGAKDYSGKFYQMQYWSTRGGDPYGGLGGYPSYSRYPAAGFGSAGAGI